MQLRADYDAGYFRRFLIIAGCCIAFTGWCFYDALVKYPGEMERAKVYWTASDDPGEKYDGMERDQWIEMAASNQWPTKIPAKPDKLEHSIQQQYFFAALCIVGAIICLIKWFVSRGTWVEGSETELTSSWGEGFQYKDIQSIDKFKWEKKGIAKVHHVVDGVARTFVMDDFKFDRETMSQIMTHIEQGLQDDQITGGDRETVIQKRKEKKLAARKAAQEAT